MCAGPLVGAAASSASAATARARLTFNAAITARCDGTAPFVAAMARTRLTNSSYGIGYADVTVITSRAVDWPQARRCCGLGVS
jgi:hypothetical protein